MVDVSWSSVTDRTGGRPADLLRDGDAFATAGDCGDCGNSGDFGDCGDCGDFGNVGDAVSEMLVMRAAGRGGDTAAGIDFGVDQRLDERGVVAVEAVAFGGVDTLGVMSFLSGLLRAEPVDVALPPSKRAAFGGGEDPSPLPPASPKPGASGGVSEIAADDPRLIDIRKCRWILFWSLLFGRIYTQRDLKRNRMSRFVSAMGRARDVSTRITPGLILTGCGCRALFG